MMAKIAVAVAAVAVFTVCSMAPALAHFSGGIFHTELDVDDLTGVWRLADGQGSGGSSALEVWISRKRETAAITLEERMRLPDGTTQTVATWEGTSDRRSIFVSRYPTTAEMNPDPAVPDWAKTQVQGKLLWSLSLNRGAKDGRRTLTGSFDPREIEWRERSIQAKENPGRTRSVAFVQERCGPPTLAVPAAFAASTGKTLRAHNWRLFATVSPGAGLVVTDLQIGARYVAAKLSVPYIVVEAGQGAGVRCKLKPDGDDAQCRSRLVDLQETQDTEKLVLEALYLLDRIPGGGCLYVRQQYVFRKEMDPAREGTPERCEPLGEVTCARFFPIVQYRYLPVFDPSRTPAADLDRPPGSFRIKVAQRLHFSVDSALPRRGEDNGNRGALHRDCEIPSELPLRACVGVGEGQFMWNHGGNPMSREMSATALPRTPGGQVGGDVSVDNYHQTSRDRVSLPDFIPPRHAGCPECVHVHWRWPTVATLPPPLGGGPQFRGGEPVVPAGSTQSVRVAVVRWHRDRPDEEDPADVEQLVNFESLVTPVFWYVASSTLPTDAFMAHGAFVSSFRTIPEFRITTTELPAAKARTPYQARIVVDGGEPPYDLRIHGLPSGVTIETPTGAVRTVHGDTIALSGVSGGPDGGVVTVTGTPQAPGTSSIRVRAYDKRVQWRDGTFTLDVRPPD